MKIKQRICDFCSEPIVSAGDLIIKEKWISWHESGWQRLDVCIDCAKKIRSFIKENKNESGTDK